jgi:mannosyltransferase
MGAGLPDVIVANLHRRYTGVSATVRALVPALQAVADVGVVDTGGLGLERALRLRDALRGGWTPPSAGTHRVWHANRDVEMLAGLLLRAVPGQRWRLMFTSAAPHRHSAPLRWLMNRMDAVVSVSERSAAWLDWHTAVIPHGVDTDLFVPPADRAAALAEAGLPGRYALGCFGRVRESKGIDVFVQAMLELLPRYPDFVAVIVGSCRPEDAAFRDALVAQVAAAGLSGRIRFTGEVGFDELRRWYQRISILVGASRREGFGLTAAEAFASGACAVTTTVGSWPWMIAPDCGRLVETGSLRAMVEGLAPIMADPALMARMGAAGRAHAVANLSIRAEAAAYRDLYARLAQGPVPRRQAPSIPAALTAK